MLITPYDLLCPAGESATLEVEVERRWLTFVDPPLADLEVEVEGFGRARSGADGRASFPLGVLSAGTHRLPVRCGRKEVEAIVRVVPADAPILVVDIDQTIADVTPQGFIFRPVKSVRPLPGSREALEELSRSMEILYLSARDHIFTRKTKIWLRAARMPEAPLYLRKGTRFWSASPRDHKIARLTELRPKFKNLAWGVGDRPGDVIAYRHHSIRPIMLSPFRPLDLPNEVPCVADWNAVLAELKKG